MYRTSFSDAEWNTVMFTPLWAFYAVAGIDKKIDDKEASALSKELVEAGLYKDEFTREVLSAIASDFAANMQAYNADRRDILKGLMEAGQLLDAKMGAKADDFKRTCLGVAINAAKASGPIIGDKVSKDEKKALVLVAAALRVPLQA